MDALLQARQAVREVHSELHALQRQLVERSPTPQEWAHALASATTVGAALKPKHVRATLGKTDEGPRLLADLDAHLKTIRFASPPLTDAVKDAIAFAQCRCADLEERLLSAVTAGK